MSKDETYTRMIELLRSGGRLPRAMIDEILTATNKTDRDLTSSLFTGPATDIPQPGDPCPTCGDVFIVGNSKRRAGYQVQYLECRSCGQSAGRRVVPSATIRRRQPKKLPA